MSSYTPQSKGVVNRYWKRPKLRVYECNIRDTERFYQQAYKDYLEAKEYAARKSALERTSSAVGDDSVSRWGIRRANSLLESITDPTRFDVMAMEGRGGCDGDLDALTYKSAAVRRARNKSPTEDATSIEERLKRIQALRTELGIVADPERADRVAYNPMLNGDAFAPDPRGRRGRTLETGYPSAVAGRSRGGGDFSLDAEDSALQQMNGTEKTTRFARKMVTMDDSIGDSKGLTNGRASSYALDDDKYAFKSSLKARADDSADKYSFKSCLKAKKQDFGDADDDAKYSFKSALKNRSQDYGDAADDTKYSFKSSLKSRRAELDDDMTAYKPPASRRGGRQAAAADLDAADDDDALLSNIKKKFPTSDEILERIKKMDSEI